MSSHLVQFPQEIFSFSLSVVWLLTPPIITEEEIPLNVAVTSSHTPPHNTTRPYADTFNPFNPILKDFQPVFTSIHNNAFEESDKPSSSSNSFNGDSEFATPISFVTLTHEYLVEVTPSIFLEKCSFRAFSNNIRFDSPLPHNSLGSDSQSTHNNTMEDECKLPPSTSTPGKSDTALPHNSSGSDPWSTHKNSSPYEYFAQCELTTTNLMPRSPLIPEIPAHFTPPTHSSCASSVSSSNNSNSSSNNNKNNNQDNSNNNNSNSDSPITADTRPSISNPDPQCPSCDEVPLSLPSPLLNSNQCPNKTINNFSNRFRNNSNTIEVVSQSIVSMNSELWKRFHWPAGSMCVMNSVCFAELGFGSFESIQREAIFNYSPNALVANAQCSLFINTSEQRELVISALGHISIPDSADVPPRTELRPPLTHSEFPPTINPTHD